VEQEQGGSSDQEGGERVVAAGTKLRKRRRPSWADDRPGCWLLGQGEEDFYVQQGDFVFTAAAAKDPLAFVVPPSSSSGGLGAYVHLFKVLDVSRDSLTASCFWNEQHDLLQPLLYQALRGVCSRCCRAAA
jgi:hypothetical protein